MFVLTVDQVDSRHSRDRVAAVVADDGRARWHDALLGPDRTAGDEFQLVVGDASSAVAIALDLIREGGWSVGVGVGPVALPLPATTREAVGDAFVAARAAVEAAKRSSERLVVVAAGDRAGRAEGVTGLLGLLVEQRARRSPEGWAVADLVAEGLPQARIAERLGVTPQAISLRARAAGVRLELAAVPAVVEALARLDPSDPVPTIAA